MPDLYLKFEGRKYPFDYKDVTVGKLRQIKAWYGTELGTYVSFLQAIRVLDPEACLCALWIARLKAGESNVPEPNNTPDFEIPDFLEVPETLVEDEDPPTKGDTPTPGSTETPTDSVTNGSPVSPTSAI